MPDGEGAAPRGVQSAAFVPGRERAAQRVDAAGDLFLQAQSGNLASRAKTRLPRATRRTLGSAGRFERRLRARKREKEQRRELESERS